MTNSSIIVKGISLQGVCQRAQLQKSPKKLLTKNVDENPFYAQSEGLKVIQTPFYVRSYRVAQVLQKITIL
jgi:hypothetical protein